LVPQQRAQMRAHDPRLLFRRLPRDRNFAVGIRLDPHSQMLLEIGGTKAWRKAAGVEPREKMSSFIVFRETFERRTPDICPLRGGGCCWQPADAIGSRGDAGADI